MIINEREQMKKWIAISESQQLDEGLMQIIMAPFRFLGGAMAMVWNIVKGVVKILGFIIEYSGKATMLISAPVSWISRALTILFRALAGTGHFMNEFGKDVRRFLESENLDADAIMEEKGDVEQMIRDIHDAIKDLNVRTSDETKGSVGGWTIDSNAIYRGTELADDTFASSNGQITLGAGFIGAKQFI